MLFRPQWSLVLVLAALMTVVGCTGDDGPVVVQPGPPGETGRVLEDGPPPWQGQPHSALDVAFLHAMIAHHEQALRMTTLVPTRAEHDDIALLAYRIELSQEAEIALMEAWLADRGEAHADSHHEHGAMAGMLTEEQFAELEAATGAEFDSMFLESMIFHHEGALVMVENLLAAGGAQEPEMFQLVSHVESDQRIEIDRMRRLLAGLG